MFYSNVSIIQVFHCACCHYHSESRPAVRRLVVVLIHTCTNGKLSTQQITRQACDSSVYKKPSPCRIPMNVAFVHFAKQSQKRIKTCRSLLQTPTGAFGTHLDIQSILLLAWIYTLGGEKKASACSNHHSFFSGYLHNK